MTATDQMLEAFNPSTEEGTPDLGPLPKGWYVASIIDAIIKPYKTGKGQGVFLTWEIADEKFQGRKIWDQCTLSHENETAMRLGRQRFKDICDSCGVTQAFTDLTLLYDKPCLIWVKIVEDPNGEYPPKNAVSRAKPVPAGKSANGGGQDKPFNDEIPY